MHKVSSIQMAWRFEDGCESIKDDDQCGRPACVKPTLTQEEKDLIYQTGDILYDHCQQSWEYQGCQCIEF